ncbi:MAG: histone deacetylase family protein [Alphaproteobacteria bacterium]
MTTIVYTHPACIAHDPGPNHPEAPQRLRAIAAALAEERFAPLERRAAPLAELSQIERVHPRAYIDQVFRVVPKSGHSRLDADTVLSPASGDAALRATGAVLAAVDEVLGGGADGAFCAVRPPGHHAEPRHAMGFCVFNSVAVAAEHARAVHGLERVAVVDFDVHHGNGTQAMFENVPDLFYASTHQWPLYPGTGAPNERGVADNIVNAILRPGEGSAEFREAVTGAVLPALRRFRPELIIVSAGFDGHTRDPLAQINLATEDYAWVTRVLTDAAAELCDGRIVSALEGGYDLEALAASVAVHVSELMGG